MQHSAGLTVDHPSSTHRSALKRKSPQEEVDDNHYHLDSRGSRQSTISELFQKSSSASPTNTPSPPTKRLRYSSDLSQSHGTIPPEKMYNFASPASKSNNVVDLTGSPSSTNASSPLKKPSMANRTCNFNPHTGPKRLVVKNLRTTPRVDPDEYYRQAWGQIDAALISIFKNEKVSQSLEELYRAVENICRQGKASKIYHSLSERCRQYLSSDLKESITSTSRSGNDVEVLKSVLNAWTLWNRQLSTIRSIFFYLDRAYLLHSKELSINEMAVSSFRSCVLSDQLLDDRVMHGTVDLANFDRRKEEKKVDNESFKQAIIMFQELGMYTNEFEPKMLAAAQEYYDTWASEQCSRLDLAGYVEECQNIITTELSRCDLFNLANSTRRDLLVKLENILIKQYESLLISEKEVSKLLDANSIHTLENLYLLLERERLGVKLKGAFHTYILSTGRTIVFDEARENEMIVRLLEFKRKLDNIWQVAFHKHEVLGHSLREGFEQFINESKKSASNWGTTNNKPGEMIAKYVDVLLRSGAKAIPTTLVSGPSNNRPEDDELEVNEDLEINKQLDQVLDLFRFIHGKAVFEAFYKRDLARRLLMGRSASADAERSMLARLKSECGDGFTQNLEQMFRDIDLARDEMNSYKMILEQKNKTPELDLSVNVLSTSAWPTYPDVHVIIPPSIGTALDDFERHYRSTHTGRKLAWKHALAHCIVKAAFPKGNKELVVSSFQAIVMVLFNDVPREENLSYRDIQAATGLSDAELKRTLQSLACAKYRVLSKTPKGRDVNEEDTFSVNLTFSDAKYRVKINQIQLKETKEENKETHERVAADRHYETQAAIVWIMKSRKTITHPDLVAEVIKATKSRGVLDPADIKKNIEKLIEKEYMEREEGNKYTYLA